MNLSILKARIKQKIKRMQGIPEPFLCIITPVFDPALESFVGLVQDLQRQRCKEFIHVAISNGKSEEIRKFVDETRIRDKRFIFDEIPFDDAYSKTGSSKDLLANIGKRRDFVMQKYDAKRYLNLGADFQITDDNFIQKLKLTHEKTGKDIIITKVNLEGKEFPLFPINKLAHIDLSNFSYSKKVARKYHYPNNFLEEFDMANDYRYFNAIINFTFMEEVFGNKDGRRSYTSLADLWRKETKNED